MAPDLPNVDVDEPKSGGDSGAVVGAAVGGSVGGLLLVALIVALICRAKRSSSNHGNDARPAAQLRSSEYASSAAMFRVQSDAPAYDQLLARESHYASSAADFQIADKPTYAAL